MSPCCAGTRTVVSIAADGAPSTIRTVAALVGNPPEQTVGILMGVTNLDIASFISRIIGIYGGKHGSILIIDPRNGRFVAATDPPSVLQPIPAPGVNRMHDATWRA